LPIKLFVKPLQIEKDLGVVIVRFTRPEIRNPLSGDVLDRLYTVVEDVREDPSTKALIFTGSADVFASGADLREIRTVTDDRAADFALYGQALMTKIDELPVMTIAAINGYCFGGALDLALSCKKRFAAPDAKFAHPGTSLGIITGWGGTQRLPRLIGRTHAMEMFFTARPINAERALAIGLIGEIAYDPLARGLEFVRTA
jgi:enoyl-CoA hydratase